MLRLVVFHRVAFHLLLEGGMETEGVSEWPRTIGMGFHYRDSINIKISLLDAGCWVGLVIGHNKRTCNMGFGG